MGTGEACCPEPTTDTDNKSSCSPKGKKKGGLTTENFLGSIHPAPAAHQEKSCPLSPHPLPLQLPRGLIGRWPSSSTLQEAGSCHWDLADSWCSTPWGWEAGSWWHSDFCPRVMSAVPKLSFTGQHEARWAGKSRPSHHSVPHAGFTPNTSNRGGLSLHSHLASTRQVRVLAAEPFGTPSFSLPAPPVSRAWLGTEPEGSGTFSSSERKEGSATNTQRNVSGMKEIRRQI